MPAKTTPDGDTSHIFGVLRLSICRVVTPLSQVSMTSRFHRTTRAAAIAAMLAVAPLALATQVLAQSDDADPEMRIQQLENQLRQLTGQNEELQYRNRQLEDRLRLLQGGAQAAPGGQAAVAQPGVAQPNVATLPPVQQPGPVYQQPQARPGYEPQIAAPPSIMQEPQGVPPVFPCRDDRQDRSRLDRTSSRDTGRRPRDFGQCRRRKTPR